MLVGGLDLDLDKARELIASLRQAVASGSSSSSAGLDGVLAAAGTVSARLAELLKATAKTTSSSKGLQAPSFSPDTISRRNDAVVAQLFRLPHVCSTDGFRFEHPHQLEAHREVLRLRARERREQVQGEVSRTWMSTTEQWCSDFATNESGPGADAGPASDAAAVKASAETPLETAEEEPCVVVDPAITKCRICGEPLERFWNQDREEWFFRSAIEVRAIEDPSEKVVVHSMCAKAVSSQDGNVRQSQLLPVTPRK